MNKRIATISTLVLFFALAFVTNVSAQVTKGTAVAAPAKTVKMKTDNNKKAEIQVSKLRKQLSLDKKQYKTILDLRLNLDKTIQEIKSSDATKEAKHQKIGIAQKMFNKKMQSVLTEEQNKRYKQLRADRRASKRAMKKEKLAKSKLEMSK